MLKTIATLALTASLCACGGGSDAGEIPPTVPTEQTATVADEAPPVACVVGGITLWCGPSGPINGVEHHATRSEHQAAGRPFVGPLDVDGLLVVCEPLPGVFVLGECKPD